MRMLCLSVLLCLVFMSLALAGEEGKTTAARPEVRGMWVVRTTLTSPEKISAMIRRAKEGNFNTLIVQVRGRGDAWYRSRWEPRADELKDAPESFDPLAQVIREAHDAGLKVHAWVNMGLTCNVDARPTSPAHIVNRRPEWLMVHRGVAAQLYRMSPKDPRYLQALITQTSQDRAEIEGLYASYAVPEVKEHLYSVAMDVVERYDVDGLHLDYIRYASKAFDYNRVTLDRFRAEVEAAMSAGERKVLSSVAATDPLVYTAVFPEKWAQFLRDQVTGLVERISVGARMRKPGASMTAAVFADDESAFGNRFQDWRLWLERGYLDAVCPMAYTTDTETFKRQVQRARAFAMGRQVWAGVGAFQMPVESALEKIDAARAVGVEGVVIFSYDAMVQPSATNPRADYIDRLKSAAFGEPSALPPMRRAEGEGEAPSP